MDQPSKTEVLRSLMHHANIPSFRALRQAACISDWQIEQLRRGKIAQMRVEVLFKLSHALQVSLQELLTHFSDSPDSPLSSSPPSPLSSPSLASPPSPSPDAGSTDDRPLPPQTTQLDTEVQQLKQEYERLQTQLAQQRDRLQQEFQAASLQVLEPWLTYFPTAAHKAQQNPDLPATRLLPLVRPVEKLVESWGVEVIAAVGSQVPYDPRIHQVLDGAVQPGDLVEVFNAGYQHGETLLHRAKVRPVKPE